MPHGGFMHVLQAVFSNYLFFFLVSSFVVREPTKRVVKENECGLTKDQSCALLRKGFQLVYVLHIF